MTATEDTKSNKPSQEPSPKSAKSHSVGESHQSSSPMKDGASTTLKSEASTNEASKGASSNAQPLAPPPKPSESGDYFSGNPGGGSNSHFSLEPNPFEQSFGNPSAETPGKFGGLPSVASLTSPQPLGPGGTPNWQNSLRSGPLSPALLPGPSNSNSGYFDDNFRNSLPTPNESSVRTGLTPGGGTSMFPAPSPNSQAIFNLQSGGATPGTLDFHRTAMNARARQESQSKPNGASNGPAVKSEYPNNQQQSQPQQQAQAQAQAQVQAQAQNQAGRDALSGNAAEGDAVNSLFMLAQNGNRSANQFAQQQQQQQQQQQINTNVAQMQQGLANSSQNTSPATQSATRPSGNTADYEGSDAGSEPKPAPKGRGKKGGGAAKGAANGKRKSEGGQSGGRKRSKTSINAAEMTDAELEEDFDSSLLEQEIGSGNKKVSEEDKRKNFLERNRIAALKCRQRKKQWLANLQTKVEIFTSENDALQSANAQLREEVVNLKTLLVAHKDCPVSHSQGLGGQNMLNVMGEIDHQNFNGMAMPNAQMMSVQQGGQGMQRS